MPEQATLVTVNEPNETANINFALSAGGAISGEVADKENEPLAGAIVQAYFTKTDSLFFRGFGMALTEEDGTYKIIGLEPGAYVVSAEAWTPWSYAQQWYKNVGSPDSATVIQVEEEQAVTGIDFTLDLPKIAGSINGVVTNLKGEPLADASIQAYSPADSIELKPRFWGYANTDSSGRYRIDLPAGDYIVMASAYNGWQSVVRWYPNVSTPDSAVLVTVEKDVDREGIDFKLPIVDGDGVIAGKVTAEDGRALAGAFIEVMPATAEPAWKSGLIAAPTAPAIISFPNCRPANISSTRNIGKMIASASNGICWPTAASRPRRSRSRNRKKSAISISS
jgi:protocatechuate 3,4-dioxygenase beta subunit